MQINLYNRLVLRARLVHHEAYRTHPYTDSTGNLSIGIGHNLTANGLPDRMIEELFEMDLAIAEDELRGFPWWHRLDPIRKTVLVELNFNMGLKTLQTFKKMLAALTAGDYKQASVELVDSKWYAQVGAERGHHLANTLETGHH